ncbi:MAG: sulfite exporter TauE/SafE family protein [Candidatus Omnitrophica bacterium]|nr:sulfite exporter TauE/SafE family protein [Candidatus Omnitrophota bacterium]MBU0881504.1 sulfite exporter TauE/SafE family protein [Candidatus Omnitrophota bacterium]MBU1808549.1 sulfite exporter TauE/SafE family protein [Candidatus Omnitrophota bacterium]
MLNDLITHLQIFGIGFTFAIAGPCLLVCTPILLTYIAGRQDKWQRALADIAIFLLGRSFAYVALGAIAGGSGFYLRQFVKSNLTPYFDLASGAISVLLGIFVLIYKDPLVCAEKGSHNKVYGFGSILGLGFLIGINPCPPLVALLFEIALISKSALEGALYALSFGLGTFLAGLIVIGTLAGILKGFTRKMIHSKRAGLIFRIFCSILLFLFGLGLIRSGIKAL